MSGRGYGRGGGRGGLPPHIMAKYEEKAYQERKIAQHNELMAGLEYVEEYEVTKPKVMTGSMLRDCSSIDRRVNWGKKKEKVELKDTDTYVDPSIETGFGKSEPMQYLKKDMTMMGKQKPTRQLQLDDGSFFGSATKVESITEATGDTEMSHSSKNTSYEGENIDDHKEPKNHNIAEAKFPVKELKTSNKISQVHNEEKNLLMRETKDEEIRRMSKKEMTRVLSEWKNTYKTYKKEFSKLNLYQLRNEVRKIRDEMLPMKMTSNTQTMVQQKDPTKIVELSGEPIVVKSSGKDTRKTPIKSKKKTKISSDHQNQELPVVATRDKQVILTPRTSDASLTRLKKEQLFELVKSWAKYNGTVGNGLFKGMNKPSLVSEAKRVRKALAKAWTKKYNISMKSNTEGYICINKKTTDEEIRNLDIEKLTRIIQWWNVEWGEDVKNEDYNLFTKCELIEKVLKVRKELETSGYPKLKKLGSRKQVNSNVKSEIEKEQVIARKMTPLEKTSSE